MYLYFSLFLEDSLKCTAGTLGATATWGIAISAIFLLGLLVFGTVRVMHPQWLLKNSKTSQGTGEKNMFK
jgi:hypothetical protein